MGSTGVGAAGVTGAGVASGVAAGDTSAAATGVGRTSDLDGRIQAVESTTPAATARVILIT
jgi:hypothetical protein